MLDPSRFYPARQILPNLWIGSAGDAANPEAARRRRIRLVINCSRDIPEEPMARVPGARVYRIPIDDWTGEGRALLRHLPVAVEMIDGALGAGQGVLVHCYAGMQRSAAVVAAYLVWKYGYSAGEAMRRVQLVKPETFQPEPTFERALRSWQRFVVGTRAP